MSKLMLFLTGFLLLAVIPVGCSEDTILNPFKERTLPAEIQADAGSIVEGNNRFALDLYSALNDAVIHKTGFARLITMRVWVDGDEVGQYSADGIENPPREEPAVGFTDERDVSARG